MSIKEKIAEIRDKIARIAVKTATVATLMGPSCACSENTQDTDKNEDTVEKTGVVFRAAHNRTASDFLLEDGTIIGVSMGSEFSDRSGLIDEGDTLIYNESKEGIKKIRTVRFKNANGRNVNMTRDGYKYKMHR